MSDDPTPPAASDKPKPLRDRIWSLAQLIASERFGTGERASLRRADPATVLGQPAFFRALAETGIEPAEEMALVWAAIVHCVAQTAGNGATMAAGVALAEAGLSESRFARLMAARGDTLVDQLCLVARYLAAKQTPVNWADLAELALADAADDAARLEKARFRIARGFYRTLHAADRRAAAGA